MSDIILKCVQFHIFFMSLPINICEEILKHLDEQNRPIGWLAKELGHEPSALRKLLHKNHELPSYLLFRISKILDKDFHACYSRLLITENI